MLVFHKRFYSFRSIASYIQIKQIDVADVVVWVGIESATRKLRFGDPQNAPVNLGIANAR